MKKHIHLGTDHAGFEYKEAIKAMLLKEGYQVTDHGAHQFEELDDYPDFVAPAAEAVSKDPEGSVAIVLGGSGEGEAMVANKFPGVRAALGFSEFVVKASREHNNANVLSLGQRTVTRDQALAFVKLWLGTPFAGDARHVRRLQKIAALEQKLLS